jgi:hypothetical protein
LGGLAAGASKVRRGGGEDLGRDSRTGGARGDALALALGRGATAAGRLRDAGGAPVGQVWLRFVRDGLAWAEARTDETGAFEARALPGGAFAVEVFESVGGKGQWTPCGSIHAGAAGVELVKKTP